MSWTQSDAVGLCRVLESVVPQYGCHVALTGGTLYKEGIRKDCDVLFYRIRQWKCISMDGMWEALSNIGFHKQSGFGWCYKATYHGKPVDCFFPEGARDEDGNEIEYQRADPQDMPMSDFELGLTQSIRCLQSIKHPEESQS